jgi:hypothetical protein
MKKEKLWLRIPITLVWLCLILFSVFLWIPSINVIYQGNVYFDSAEKYEAFKSSLANDKYGIDKLEVTNDGGKLVSFKVYAPRNDSFPYGTRNDQGGSIIVIDCMILMGCCALAFVSAWSWGK